jgi:DNA repair photolyase
MITNTKNGGQITANTANEVAADAAASLEQNNGTGIEPSQGKGEMTMQESEKTGERPQVAAAPERAEIPLDKIVIDEEKYPRDHIDVDAVEEYAAAMKAGAQFPDIEVYSGSGTFFDLSDGRHRVEASRRAEKVSIWAKVYMGTKDDATLHALAANADHGVRRTNADKRKAVMILMSNPEWRQWSDNEIAKRCRVSWDLVKSVRAEYDLDHPQEAELGKPEGKKCKRNGTEYVQKLAVAAKPLPAHVAAIAEMRELARSARAAVPQAESKLAEALDRVGSELHEILGKATGAKYRMADLPVPLNVYQHKLEGGIKESPEFERKGLATHAVNVGLGCGHQCSYCSSPCLRCRLPAYGEIQISAYDRGFAVIDPKSGDRISRDKPKLTAEDTVMLSTCDDAWAPEARKHGVGRKCLEVLVKETTARVRVLTKSSKVTDDLDVAKGNEGRVMVGLSTGIPCSREEVAKAVEPNASGIGERLAALKQAHGQGFGTYAMLCPCLPLVADTEAALKEMFRAVMDCGVSDIWLEPVNARGKALPNTEEALRVAGLKAEADAVAAIRDQKQWSKYAADLAETAAGVAEKLGLREKLHVLMYTDKLTAQDLGRVKALGGCVILLGKGSEAPESEAKAKAGKGKEDGQDAA